ncbi:MAG: hypothetical protein R3185_09380 [Candidatus Thermoplasmatota archaeon]|nr:hypothetical protein [Candidatus Thermoplasmatota archaeon]
MNLARFLHRLGVVLFTVALLLVPVGALQVLYPLLPWPRPIEALALVVACLVVGLFLYGLGVLVELRREGKRALGLK